MKSTPLKYHTVKYRIFSFVSSFPTFNLVCPANMNDNEDFKYNENHSF